MPDDHNAIERHSRPSPRILLKASFFAFSWIFALSSGSAAEPDEARLRLFSSQADSYVFIDNLCSGVLQAGETRVFGLKAGKHKIRVAKAGFDEIGIQISLRRGQTQNFAATLRPNPSMQFRTALVLDSEPRQASVFVCSVPAGKSPLKLEGLPPGAYGIKFSVDLHHPVEKMAELNERETVTLRERLAPAFGFLTVSTVPEGARVLLDDKLIGRSPLQRQQVTSGKYRLVLDAPLFAAVSKAIVIRNGEETIIREQLPEHSGAIEVQTEPVVASVMIDGAFKGKTPLTAKLPPGDHVLELVPEINNYKIIKERIFVFEGKVTPIVKTLEVAFGNLSVISEPSDASIYLSSTYYGINKKLYGTTTKRIANLPAGAYRLELELPGYRGETREVVIGDEDTTEVNLSLHRDRTTYKYSVIGISSGVLAASLAVGILYTRKVYDNQATEQRLYESYQSLYTAQRLPVKWKAYKKAFDEGKMMKLIALSSYAVSLISGVFLLHGLSIPQYEAPDDFSLALDPIDAKIGLNYSW